MNLRGISLDMTGNEACALLHAVNDAIDMRRVSNGHRADLVALRDRLTKEVYG